MAANWPKLPALDSPDELDAPLPTGWRLDQIENLYEQLPIGKRFDQRSSNARGLVPVIDQSEAGVIGWHDEEPGVVGSDRRPVVTFANHTCEMRWMRRPFSVIQNVFPLIGKSDACETRFLYYGTKGRVHLEEYKGHFPDYRRKWIPVPPLDEQRAIAHILGTLDDKIELNRRMSETLEAMARALFKSWFVDFEPVRAQSEGRDPGLPQPTADLFPGEFVDSELGEIPKDWKVTTIGGLAEIVGGTTPSTEIEGFWREGVHAFATPKDLSILGHPVLLETERKVSDLGLARIGSGLLPAGTVLLSSRAPIGYLAIAELPVAINQGFIAMQPKPGVSNLFLLLWAKAAEAEILSRANGSTFLEISKASFRPIPVAVPPDRVMCAFERIARGFYSRLVVDAREVRVLTALRNALLPKLLSGDLRVHGF